MLVFLNKIFDSSYAKFLIKLIVSLALFYYCLSLVDLNDVYSILMTTDKFLFLLCVMLVTIGTVICKSYMIWSILISKNNVALNKVVAINLAMRFYTMLLPKAAVAVIRWNKYRLISDPKYAFLLVSFEAMVALFFAALMTLVFIFIDASSLVPHWVIWVSISVLVALAAIIYIFFISINGNLFIIASKVLERILFFVNVKNLINKWKESAELLKLRKSNILSIVVLSSIVGHIAFLLGGYFLFLAMGIEVEFYVLAWIRSFVFILVSVPISLAGIGVREISFISLFGIYGYASDYIISYALLALVVQLIIGLVGMLVEVNTFFDKKSL